MEKIGEEKENQVIQAQIQVSASTIDRITQKLRSKRKVKITNKKNYSRTLLQKANPPPSFEPYPQAYERAKRQRSE